MNVKAAHEALLEAARNNTTIAYGDLIQIGEIDPAGKMGSDAISGALGRLLYDIVHAELAQNPKAPMLSAIALPKHGNEPAEGFYVLAEGLGRYQTGEDKMAFWVKELNACYAYWD